MEAGGIPVISLSSYLTQDRTIVIPPWQREYSWSTSEDEQVDTLLKDLLKFLQDPDSNEYLIGSVVLCSLKDQPNRPLLIDGQQRTLTLTLLLMCCQKFLRTYDLIDGKNPQDTTLDSLITSCINSNSFQAGALAPRVEMKRSDADDTLRDLYNWAIIPGEYNKSVFKDMDKKNPTQKNLINSTEFIYRKLVGSEKHNKDKTITKKPGEWLQESEMKKGILKLLNGVKIIQIEVDGRRESISVFDHINNRGMALNPADLVKNLMFENVKDSEFEGISENWNSMVEKLMSTKKSRLQDPRYLLRSLSHIYYGAHESYDNLDVFWSKKFDENKKDSDKGMGAVEFSKKLPIYSGFLKSFVLRENSFKFPLSDIYLSGELGSIQHYSVLLAGSHLSNKDTFSLLAQQVNLRTVLYMLSEERTQMFDAMIPDWAAAVATLPPTASREDLIKIYRANALPAEGLFSDLRDRMGEWDYTTASQKKKIRAVLAILSVHLNSICKADVRIEDAMRARRVTGENHPWEIEHVLPQAKSKEAIYQSIGNLVLLSSADNNDLSANAPQFKKDHYDKCSLFLTATLTGKDVPNVNQAQKIGDLFNAIGVKEKNWDLDSWGELSIIARIDFYHAYLVYIIKSVSV